MTRKARHMGKNMSEGLLDNFIPLTYMTNTKNEPGRTHIIENDKYLSGTLAVNFTYQLTPNLILMEKAFECVVANMQTGKLLTPEDEFLYKGNCPDMFKNTKIIEILPCGLVLFPRSGRIERYIRKNPFKGNDFLISDEDKKFKYKIYDSLSLLDRVKAIKKRFFLREQLDAKLLYTVMKGAWDLYSLQLTKNLNLRYVFKQIRRRVMHVWNAIRYYYYHGKNSFDRRFNYDPLVQNTINYLWGRCLITFKVTKGYGETIRGGSFPKSHYLDFSYKSSSWWINVLWPYIDISYYPLFARLSKQAYNKVREKDLGNFKHFETYNILNKIESANMWLCNHFEKKEKRKGFWQNNPDGCRLCKKFRIKCQEKWAEYELEFNKREHLILCYRDLVALYMLFDQNREAYVAVLELLDSDYYTIDDSLGCTISLIALYLRSKGIDWGYGMTLTAYVVADAIGYHLSTGGMRWIVTKKKMSKCVSLKDVQIINKS